MVEDDHYWREMRWNEDTWKNEWIVDISHNINIRTMCDSADRITESAKSGTEVFV